VDDLSTVCVLEVDDGAPWRSSDTAHVLGTSVQVVGTAVDGLEAVQKARVLQPDVIIMDIWMPKLDGFEAISEMGLLAPGSRILIVSHESHPFVVQAALAAGVRGYLLKSLVGFDLLTALEAIVRGDLFIGCGLTTR
jgi:DNA-binding NarL/FixJ family response regulator